MFVHERRRRIVQHLRRHGSASVRELTDLTGGSDVTTRRDLQALEAEGLVSRRHGGAVLVEGYVHEQAYAEKARIASDEKASIAACAALLIQRGDAVVLGAGTTTEALARHLVDVPDLLVVTNSLRVANVMVDAREAEVVLCGGTLRPSIHALVGSAAERSLTGLRAVRAFISGNGVTAERGLTTPNPLVASIDQALAAAAREVIVLADSTKIGRETMCQTVSPERIGVLVTDSGAAQDELALLREAGVQINIAARED